MTRASENRPELPAHQTRTENADSHNCSSCSSAVP
jgi:hypothetical protein